MADCVAEQLELICLRRSIAISLADHPIFGYTERNLCKEQLTGEEGKLCFPCS